MAMTTSVLIANLPIQVKSSSQVIKSSHQVKSSSQVIKSSSQVMNDKEPLGIILAI
ncbi:unnamed protein product [Acidithrix sp. C25]|nr:unnamed protein product [Acidithrix sp. C25]